MITISNDNIVIWSIIIVIIIFCTFGIIIASIFQAKKNKKYKECLDIIKEKGNIKFEIKDGLTKEDINKIDSGIDVEALMKFLYNTYLLFVEKLKNNDSVFDEILKGTIKDIYEQKIENFKINGYNVIIDKIDLIGYSITEFSKNKLKFRITINCCEYKLLNGNIISGSNLIKMEEVILLTFEKYDEKWFIVNYEKIYEKKLSD